MPKKQTDTAPDRAAKLRGGSDSVRARGLVQLAFPLTDEERRRIHAAASLAGQSANEFVRAIIVAEVERRLGLLGI